MSKKIHFDRCEIIHGEVVHTSRDEEYPDDKVRHCDWCTVCGEPSYPECMKDCPTLEGNEGPDPD